MKIRIPAVTLEVNTKAWRLEYGAVDVRKDVREYFDIANHIPDHLTYIVRVVK